MSDFEAFDPRTWFDDSQVLVRRASASTTRKAKGTPFNSVRGLLAGIALTAMGTSVALMPFAHAGDPIAHSSQPMAASSSDLLPRGYWKAVLDRLKQAPTIQEEPDSDDSADPIL